MKKGVYIINTSRGECAVEQDVAAALNSGHIAGYATDVWEQEPPQDTPLVKASGLLGAPHIGASTAENLLRIGDIIEEKIRSLGGSL